MKKNINTGAYGWSHAHWLNTFYPEDLPADWQLAYYSNEFDAVLVPAGYWKNSDSSECEDWLDSVHEDFLFYIEIHISMFDWLTFEELAMCLDILRPQLAALVVLDDQQFFHQGQKKQLAALAQDLTIDVLGAMTDLCTGDFWRQNSAGAQENAYSSKLSHSMAYLENDLTDLRLARGEIESFLEMSASDDSETDNSTPGDAENEAKQLAVIVSHPQLQASDLSKFRSVLEIMGY